MSTQKKRITYDGENYLAAVNVSKCGHNVTGALLGCSFGSVRSLFEPNRPNQ